MLVLDLTPSTRARVWIDERPPFAPYAPDAELAGEVEAGAVAPVASEVIVEVAAKVELRAPRGLDDGVPAGTRRHPRALRARARRGDPDPVGRPTRSVIACLRGTLGLSA